MKLCRDSRCSLEGTRRVGELLGVARRVSGTVVLPPCKGAEATGVTLGDVGPWALGASAVPKNSSTHLFRWEIEAWGSPHLVTSLPCPQAITKE